MAVNSSSSTRAVPTPPMERLQLGKQLRLSVPRSEHAACLPSDERPDPISLLRQSNHRRLSHLVSLQYGRMAASPFAFMRGSAVIMAHDLASTPTTGLYVQLCGDAHIGNFGGYGTAERSLVFDLNDFDETLAGPWEWDVKRLAASAVVVAREKGLKRGAPRQIACATAQAYRKQIRELSDKPYLDVWLTPTRAAAAMDSYADDPKPLERVSRWTAPNQSRDTPETHGKGLWSSALQGRSADYLSPRG